MNSLNKETVIEKIKNSSLGEIFTKLNSFYNLGKQDSKNTSTENFIRGEVNRIKYIVSVDNPDSNLFTEFANYAKELIVVDLLNNASKGLLVYYTNNGRNFCCFVRFIIDNTRVDFFFSRPISTFN